MPTRREQHYYELGYLDGRDREPMMEFNGSKGEIRIGNPHSKPKRKRKLSAWNKFVKANSKKPRFRYARSNKINLKKMAIAFRKTPAGRKKRR